MPRVAVFLFFIVIFHNGIQKSLQAEDSTAKEGPVDSDAPSEKEVDDKNGVANEVPKIIDTGDKKGAPHEKETARNSDVTQKTVDETDQTRKAEVKAKESKKEDDKGKDGKNYDKISPLLPLTVLKSNLETNNTFPNNIIQPALRIGERIQKQISTGIDSAKNFADGTVNFFRTSFGNILP